MIKLTPTDKNILCIALHAMKERNLYNIQSCQNPEFLKDLVETGNIIFRLIAIFDKPANEISIEETLIG
jgi:hypothetical protein